MSNEGMQLYDTLYKQGQKYQDSPETREKLAYYLSQLNKKSQEVCLALIFEKNLRDSKTVKMQQRALPYRGSTILKDIGAKFSISYLPEELILILMAFIEAGSSKSLFTTNK